MTGFDRWGLIILVGANPKPCSASIIEGLPAGGIVARIVQIDWSRECSWSTFPEIRQETGIYQITREWGGWRTLLYIGIVWSNTRTFDERMNEHRKVWLNEMRGLRFRLGTIRPLKGLTRDRALVEEIEGALINELQPPGNTTKKGYYSIRHDLVIHSLGDRGFAPRNLDTTLHEWV